MNFLTMKNTLILAISLITGLCAFSQQDYQFSQNRFNITPINPGASGIKEMDCFSLIARQQWLGFEGAPSTGLLAYETYLNRFNSGLGGVLVFDQIGLEQNLFLKVNYAYHLTFNNGSKLGIGLDLGLINKQISGNVIASVPTDPTLLNFISGANESAMNLDLGFGLFYYSKNLYFGISGQKLVPQKVNWGSAQPTLKPHTYFMGGYNYAVGAEKNLVLKPSFLVKTDFVATQVDINLIGEYKELVWLGASYRIEDAIVAMVGYNARFNEKYNPIKIGLAYDFTTSNLRKPGDYTDPDGTVKPKNRSVGSVELYLGYCFVKPPKPNFDHYVDPLFLNN